MNDLRYAIRQLLKNPGFTAVAVITLALGIGANAAIFSVVNAVLLRPVPYQHPDRLVWVWENNRSKNIPLNIVSPGNFIAWQNQNHVFAGLTAWNGQDLNLTDHGDPERILGAKVFANFFEVLGMKPILGRTFFAEEDRSGAAPVALLGYGLWQRRFAGATNIIGKTVTLHGKSFTVIGVTPPRQAVPFNLFEVWLPFALEPGRLNSHDDRFLRPIGRLKAGVTVHQAQAEMDTIARRLAERHPQANAGAGVNIVPLKEMFSGEMRSPLLVLLGAVGFVLLIASANVANLTLARVSARQKEIALRVALGASRLRLMRQLLTESLLLSGLGAAAGLALAVYGVQLLSALAPTVSTTYKVPLPGVDEIRIDSVVLVFTIGLSFLTALLCGLAPALGMSRADPMRALRADDRTTTVGGRRGQLRSLLVIGEVALALILLIGAGLMITTFQHLQEGRLGFNPRNVLAITMSLPNTKYPAKEQQVEFFQQVLARVETLPGVKSAALANKLPLSGHWGTAHFTLAGQPSRAPGDFLVANVLAVSPGYYHAMEIPVLQGRTFNNTDRLGSPQVVVVNQTLARRFWPKENPLGQRLNFGDATTPDFWEIVGIAGDVRHFGLDAETPAEVYFSQGQITEPRICLIVRTTGNPLAMVNGLRKVVTSFDKTLPIFDVQTLEQLLSQSIAPRRFALFLLGGFSLLALVLAMIGIYGVISQVVTTRTREIGIRMALGAPRITVLRRVVSQGMTLTLIGLAIGLAGAAALSRFMASQLYEVRAIDPLIYTTVALVIAMVALLSCLVPARRATRIDPMVALKCE